MLRLLALGVYLVIMLGETSLAIPTFAASYYLTDPGNGRPFAWPDQNPATPQTDVYYDFRPAIDGMPNSITPSQQGTVAQAFDLWSHAGNLSFMRNETASAESIINIGVGYIDGPWQTIGRGGAVFHQNDAWGIRSISQGVVLFDAENWDLLVGNGNPPGTVDFLTVAAHEIGHALGLGHTDALPEIDLMDSVYHGELTQPSPNDSALIQSIYGAPIGPPTLITSALAQGPVTGALIMTPEPSTAAMLALGLTGIGIWRVGRHVRSKRERRCHQ